MKTLALLVAVAVFLGLGAPAYASLTTFTSFTGNVGYSSDGFGSTSQNGIISAKVPVGATVLGAYLYTSTFSNPSISGVNGTTIAGNAVTPFTNLGVNAASCCQLAAGRTDVTSIIAPLINGGAGGIYNFAVHESDGSQDGEALVVVYTLASLPVATVGILDGFSSSSGDSSAINFSSPLNPADPGFFAEMIIGDGFSCCSQESTIKINGTTITNSAGNNDDGDAVANGALITVGGFDDPFSPLLPSYTQDHERYNLVPQIHAGDTTISVNTVNPSNDDNIFLETFYVSGIAGFNAPPPDTTPAAVPEPASLLLLGTGLLGLAAFRKRSKSQS